MKITLANMFNHNSEVYVKTYDETGVHTDNHHDFDSAVHFLVKNGYTIKLQDANERGDYSLWFEKIQDPAEAKRLQDERAYFEKLNTLTGVHLEDLPHEVERKASQNDEAYTKMVAEKIAKGEIDSFKPEQEESI